MSRSHFEELGNCTYCDSKKIHTILSAPDRLTKQEGVFYLAKCRDCGLVFQNPRVREENIGQYYTGSLKYYHPSDKPREVSKLKKIKSWVYRQILINQFNYTNLGQKNIAIHILTLPLKHLYKCKLTPTYKENGKLLEIGSSHGGYLESMKEKGFEVFGIEMDKNAADYSKEVRGLKNIKHSRLEESSYEEEKFDVIAMSMVLEHLYDPFDKLKNITKWLKPGGEILISIPYFEGIEFNIFKEYSYGLQLPTHITFFNKRIIKQYLEKLGYKNIKFYFQPTERDIIASAQYKWEDTGKRIYTLVQNRFVRKLIIFPLVVLLSLLQKTSRVSIYATKNSK